MGSRKRRRSRVGSHIHGGRDNETVGTPTAGDNVDTDMVPDAPFGYAATSDTLTFVEGGGSADTITRASGSFVDDGWFEGMDVTVAGTASNNGRYLIATVAALTITLDTGDDLAAEASVSCTLASDNTLAGDIVNRPPV